MGASDFGAVLLDVTQNRPVLLDDQNANLVKVNNTLSAYDNGDLFLNTTSAMDNCFVQFTDHTNGEAFVGISAKNDNNVGLRLGVGTDRKWVMYRDTNDDLAFYNNASSGERVRFLDAGGITFGGETAAAHALDDYEEGAFTPTIESTGTHPTIAYQYQSGYYIKIGNLVYVRFGMRISTISGGSGIAEVGGIPFNSKSYGSYQQPAAFVNAQGLSTDPDGPVLFYSVDGTGRIQGRLMTNADTGLPISYFQAGTWCIGNHTFDVS
jgi:hypothetical protein